MPDLHCHVPDQQIFTETQKGHAASSLFKQTNIKNVALDAEGQSETKRVERANATRSVGSKVMFYSSKG